MSNIWRAEAQDGTVVAEFLSRDFDEVELADEHGLPLTIIDGSDCDRFVGRVVQGDRGPHFMEGAVAMTRGELVAALLKFNPWGGYCVDPCAHPGHSNEAYRKTVRRLRGDWS